MRTLFGALATALLLCGCGLTSSPAEDLTFSAPAGWQASPGILGLAQFWKPSFNSDEVLMLFRSPKPIDREEVFASGKVKDARLDEQREIRICGNQPATYIKGRAQSSVDNHPGKPHRLEVVTSNVDGVTYFAMYVSPLDRAPSPQAESALRDLCAKR
jgi:hypothetical protein